jgi:hypothetical protein
MQITNTSINNHSIGVKGRATSGIQKLQKITNRGREGGSGTDD